MGKGKLALAAAAVAIFTAGCSCQQYRRDAHAWRRSDFKNEPAPETQLLKKLMWPVTRHRITQEFKTAGWGTPHDGIDIAAPKGTRIYAPAEGRVVYAGHQFHGYGKMIIIEHKNELATIYGHCQKLLVKTGDYVERGSLIGLVGKTGHATAPHLHFEVRLAKHPVDPKGYLP